MLILFGFLDLPGQAESVPITVIPSVLNLEKAAFPIPRAAPVMIATLLQTSFISVYLDFKT